MRDAEGQQGDAISTQSGATASLPGLLKQGRLAVKCLDTVIKNRFRNDAAMLGAWKTASHVATSGGSNLAPAPPATLAPPP